MTTFVDYLVRDDVDNDHECIVERYGSVIKVYCNNLWCNFVEDNVEIEDLDATIEAHKEYHGN